jgi:hypothetical protein
VGGEDRFFGGMAFFPSDKKAQGGDVREKLWRRVREAHGGINAI